MDLGSELSSGSESAGGLTAVDDYDRSGGAAALFFSRGSALRRLVEALCYKGLQTQRRVTYRRVETAVWMLEMLQFATFSYTPAAVAGTALEPVFAIAERLRNPLGGEGVFVPALFWVWIAMAAAFLVIELFQAVVVLSGDTGFKVVYHMLAIFFVSQRVLTVPAMFFILSPLGTDYGSSGIVAVALVFVALFTLFVLVGSVFSGQWRPTLSNVSTPFTAFFSIHTACKIVLVLLQAIFHWTLHDHETESDTILCVALESTALIVISAALLLWTLVSLPYSHSFFNIGSAATFSTLLWGGIASVVGFSREDSSWRLGWGIANIAGCAAIAPLGALAAYLRLRHPDMPLPLQAKPEIEVPSFKSPIAYEIAARSLILRRKTTAGMLDRADTLFEEGVQAFPASSWLKLHYAVFLLDYKSDIPKLRMLLKNVVNDRMHKPGVLTSAVFYFITSCLRQSSIGGDDQTELDSAELHRRAAIEKLADFWGRVARSKRGVDPNVLLDIVTDLMEHERVADRIYRRVLARNVRSPAVMRQYARFLDEVRDEKDRAEMLYQEADKNEDREARKKRRKSGPQIHFGSAQAAEPQLPGALVADVNEEDEAAEEAAEAAAAGRKGVAAVRMEDASEMGRSSQASESAAAGRSSASGESVASSASAAAFSEERAKLTEYRAKISSIADKGMTQALAFVVCFAILMLAVFLATFFPATNGINTIQKGAAVAKDLSSALRDLHGAVQILEEDRFEAGFNTSQLTSVTLAMQASVFAASDDSASATVMVSWAARKMNVSYFVRNDLNGNVSTGTRYAGQTTLWDLLNVAVDNLLLLSAQLSIDINANLKPNPAIRFIFDNALEATEKTIDASKDVCSANEIETTSLSMTIIYYSSAVCAFFVLAISVSIIPLVRRFEKKREGIARIFTEIPKSESMNIFERMQRRDTHSKHHREGLTFLGARKMPPVLKLVVYIVSFAVILAVLTIAAAIVFNVVAVRASAYDSAVIEGGKQKTYFTVLKTLVTILSKPTDNEALLPEAVTRGLIPEFVEKIRDSDDAFEGEDVMEGDMFELWYSRDCPEELTAINVTCRGLDGCLTIYLDAALDLAQSTVPMAQNPSFALIRAGYAPLLTWIQESEALLFSRNVDHTKGAITACTWILVLVLFVEFFGLLFTLPSIAVVVNTTNRALNLLLMVPLSVLHRDENLRSYLERSTAVSATTSKMVLDDQEKRTRLILEACNDALVITDSRCVIETVNPAAERLLRRTADELLGTKICLVMSAETSRAFERSLKAASSGDSPLPGASSSADASAGFDTLAMTGVAGKSRKRKVKKSFTVGDTSGAMFVCKDGSQVPVLLTALVASTGEGTTIAVFARDISKIKEREAEFERERRRVDALLLNILPPSIAETLKKSPESSIAMSYPGVTVVFAEVCGFNQMAESMDAIDLVRTLNDIFEPWDKLSGDSSSGVEKIKSFGPVWMGASGLPVTRSDHAEVMVNFVLSALAEVDKLNAKRAADGLKPIAFRVGVHSGSVVAGVIGFLKFCFDIWGDTVNVASRMESTGVPNRVQVSPATLALLKSSNYRFESRGLVQVKGKGDVECFLLLEGQQPTHKLTPVESPSALPFMRELA